LAVCGRAHPPLSPFSISSLGCRTISSRGTRPSPQ
jgi:hypothetical protein